MVLKQLRNLQQASDGAADNEQMLKVLAELSSPTQSKKKSPKTEEQKKQEKEKQATYRRETLRKTREAKARAKDAEIRTKYLAHLAAIGEEPPVWFK